MQTLCLPENLSHIHIVRWRIVNPSWVIPSRITLPQNIGQKKVQQPPALALFLGIRGQPKPRCRLFNDDICLTNKIIILVMQTLPSFIIFQECVRFADVIWLLRQTVHSIWDWRRWTAWEKPWNQGVHCMLHGRQPASHQGIKELWSKSYVSRSDQELCSLLEVSMQYAMDESSD